MEARRSQSSTNGRRRRLLATQDASDLLAEFEALDPQAPAVAAPRITISSPDRQILYRMISSQLWKHCLLMLSVVALAGLAIFSEVCPPPVLDTLTAHSQPRISKGMSGAFLLVAGQLSLLIGWIRSRSTVDFSGRYRCWKWLAGCLMMIGILWITNIQDSLPQLARLFIEPLIGGVGAARRTLVVVPIASVCLWVLSRVIPDMGRNRWSQGLFGLGVLAAVARLLLSYSSTFGPFASEMLNAVLLSATGLTVCSLLLHTRFVLYISKDPPDQSATAKKRASKKQDQTKRPTEELAMPKEEVAPETVSLAAREKSTPVPVDERDGPAAELANENKGSDVPQDKPRKRNRKRRAHRAA